MQDKNMTYREWLTKKKDFLEDQIKQIDTIKSSISALSEDTVTIYQKNDIIKSLTSRDYRNLKDKLVLITNYLELINSQNYKKDGWVKIAFISRDSFRNPKNNIPILLSITKILETTKFIIIDNEDDDNFILMTDSLSKEELTCIEYGLYNKLIHYQKSIYFCEWDGEDIRNLNDNEYIKDIKLIKY